jgi:hypothetical protein
VAYISSIKYGVVNPKRLYGRYFVPQKRMSYGKVVQMLDSVKIGTVLTDIQPKKSVLHQVSGFIGKWEPKQCTT